MCWKNTRMVTLDCAAAFAGLLFALPLVLALSLPFVGGY
jgi:hypothetical protein